MRVVQACDSGCGGGSTWRVGACRWSLDAVRMKRCQTDTQTPPSPASKKTRTLTSRTEVHRSALVALIISLRRLFLACQGVDNQFAGQFLPSMIQMQCSGAFTAMATIDDQTAGASTAMAIDDQAGASSYEGESTLGEWSLVETQGNALRVEAALERDTTVMNSGDREMNKLFLLPMLAWPPWSICQRLF